MTTRSTETPEAAPVTTSIAPWLEVKRGTEALAYYTTAFGAVERYRLEDDAGQVVVAQLTVEGAAFWLQEDPEAEASPTSQNQRAIRLILTVDDPDAMFAQAIAAGATEVGVMSEDHGWRSGRIADPFGHDWEIGRPLR